MRLVIALMLAMIVFSPAAASDVCGTTTKQLTVGKGYYAGTQLNQLQDRDLALYVMGVVDGLLVSMLVGVEERCFNRIRECVAGRAGTQLAAVVRKHLRENPEDWHLEGGTLVYNAIFARCVHG